MTNKKNLVVVGNGMVGHKFLELMVQKDVSQQWNLITFCEESRVAYDRVNLSGYFSGKTAADLTLVEPGYYQENNIEIHIGDRVTKIDREQKKVYSANGVEINYDKLILATSSYLFVPPIKGNDAPGTFVYRTIEDLEAIEAYSKQSQVGVVVGGGLLGLECANALKSMGLATHVVEFAPRLMPVQIDEIGGEVLKNKIEGGLDYLKGVIIDDSLGIGDELEAQMQHLVNTYQCEWKTTLENPEKLKRFRHFVNSDRRDPTLTYVEEREQKRLATEAEKALLAK